MILIVIMVLGQAYCYFHVAVAATSFRFIYRLD